MNFRIYCLLLFSIIAGLSGCSKPEEYAGDPEVPEMLSQSVQRNQEDPFDISNIIKAYNNLVAADPSTPGLQIRPNNVYLRFLPANSSEIELLRNDTTLSLFDHPLNTDEDEEETTTGSSATGSAMTYQYCVVPVGQQLPPVRYEVLYELFIPPDQDRSVKNTSGYMTEFYDQLVSESARLTGNLTADDTSSYKTARSSGNRWNPKGRIRVWDDLLNMYIPLGHANVHARWFTNIRTCLTDEEGYFEMKSFANKVNYSIKWENSLFTIRDGMLFQAWFNGPKMKGDWNLDIKGGKSQMFATIHRAAYRQFYGDNLGLTRPTLITGGRTKICYMDGEGTGEFLGDFSAGGILPDIQVWGNRRTKPTNIVFATVSHELGHQLHSQYVGNIKFSRTSRMIRESWAEAVEWAITNDEYHKLGQKYGNVAAMRYDHDYSKHLDWPDVLEKEYSPIFIDLMDTINQGEEIGPDHPNDLISQYDISYINHYLLRNSTDISSLRRELANHKLEGVDDYKIDELFRLY